MVRVCHYGNYLGGAQPALAFMSRMELRVTEGFSSFEATLLLGDFTWCLGGSGRWKSQVDAGCGSIEVVALWVFER